MTRRLAMAVAAGAALLLVAAAQSPSTVADQVEFRGYYADSDAPIPIDGLERLAREYPRLGFVALAATPPRGADLFADEVLGAVTARDTIIVITPDEFGASSGVYGDAELAAAFDRAVSEPPDTYLDDLSQVAAALAGAPEGGVPSQGEGPGGGSFGIVVLVGLGLLGFVLWRNSRRDKQALADRLAEARAEIEAQMASVANEILEFSDRVDTESYPEAVERFRRASEIFQAAEQRLSEAKGPADLEALSSELAKAKWELEAAEAIVEGRPVPPPAEPERIRCFFDPTHRAATEQARIETAAGTREVWVCRDCADRLRRGERPEPRTVQVGGRPVPAAQAPRSYGGGGLDLAGVFSILVGGMADAVSYDWGGPRYPRRVGRSVRRVGGRSSRRRRVGRARSPRRSVGRARRSR